MFNSYNYQSGKSSAPRGNIPNGIDNDVFNPGPDRISSSTIMGKIEGEMERVIPQAVPEDNAAAYTSIIHNIPVC